MKTWIRRALGAAVLGAFLPLATVGCFGKFQLTRKVYNWNQQVDPDQWIRWFVFILMSPIYGFSVALDTVFANSVEFWTGENPITSGIGRSKTARSANGEEVTLTKRADGALDVVVRNSAGETARLVVVTESDGLSAWDEEGRLLARVADVGGQPMLVGGVAAGH